MGDFLTVYSALLPTKAKWLMIGVCLGLRIEEMEGTEKENIRDGLETCLRKMVSMWLKQRELNPSWQTLVNVLGSVVIGEQGVADDIQQKHMKETPVTPLDPKSQICPLGKSVKYADCDLCLSCITE